MQTEPESKQNSTLNAPLQRLRVLFLQRNYGLLALDVLVDGLGGGFAGTHGLDDGSGAGHGVTASVHTLAAGLALIALGDDAAMLVGLQARGGGADERVVWCPGS